QRVDAGQAEHRFLVDVLTGRHEALDHHAADRRADRALLELRSGQLDFAAGLLAPLVRLVGAAPGDTGFGARLVQVGLGDEVLAVQLLRALQFAARQLL